MAIINGGCEGCLYIGKEAPNKDTSRFFEISISSSFELETQLLGCIKIGYFTDAETLSIISKLNTFQRKTNRYMQALQ